MRRKVVSDTTNKIGQSTTLIGEPAWSQLFASKTLVALLKVFCRQSDTDFYQRELADAAGTGLYAVQRELARLERTGLVQKIPNGNRVYYRADQNHPVFEDLKRLILKTVGLGDALREGLAPLAERVKVAFVFGSFARGEATATSDLDLLLVGRLTLREAVTTLRTVSRDLGREVNPVIYPPEEFRKKHREGHHFIKELVAGPKIFLVGNENELANLVE
ncbi:MAG: nucleotidyltransferase domain-containing protein [Deltaproteobacteria bacterium]|nr:nucleotidyltransferase domain-containing protein [Deltaproteobacteria bacterium]